VRAATSSPGWKDQSEQVTRQLLLNVEAPIQLTRALLPRLRKPAIIMNIGSSLGPSVLPATASIAPASSPCAASASPGEGAGETGIKVLHFAPRATRTHLNSEAAYAMMPSSAPGPTAQDVAEEAVIALCNETRRRWLGWPEKLFVRLNGLLPALVDMALAKQRPIIERHARRTASQPPITGAIPPVRQTRRNIEMKHATFRPRFGHGPLLLALGGLLASGLAQAADALPTIQQVGPLPVPADRQSQGELPGEPECQGR
jgi:NAD(P)-dependent dehydrogenase (short-subunit alcohol dehydrogenase family)